MKSFYFSAALSTALLTPVNAQMQIGSPSSSKLAPGATGPADNLTVTAAGGVARSLMSRLRDEINVLDYGAKGDCVTDDAPAINSAWSTGKGLFFPEGCFIIKTPMVFLEGRSGAIRGLGQGVSIVKAGAPMSAMVAKAGGEYWTGYQISEMTFNGDTKADYILDIQRMAVGNFSGNDFINPRVANIRLGNGSLPVQNTFWNRNNLVNEEGLYAPASGKTVPIPDFNILLQAGATDNHFTDNIVANVKIANIKDASSYGQNFFLHNHAYGFPISTNYAQYCFWSLGGSQFIGNEVDGCSVAGFRLDGDNTSVIGSHFQWPQSSVGTAVGVLLASGANYNVVVNNKALNGHIAPDRLIVQAGTPGFGNILSPNAGATDTANQSQGRAAKSGLVSAFVRSNGFTYNPGDRQEVTQILLSQTTGATPKRLTADGDAVGAANTFNISQYQAWAFSIRATCRSADTGDTAMWYLDSEQITRGDLPASTALTGNPTGWTRTRATAGASTWAMTYGADTANGALALTFTGQASNRIACHAIVTGMSGA